MKTKNKILPEQEEEKTFQYRTYGKGELALLYLPNILQQSAVDRFNEWIEAAPGLKERLLATGMNPRSRLEMKISDLCIGNVMKKSIRRCPPNTPTWFI